MAFAFHQVSGSMPAERPAVDTFAPQFFREFTKPLFHPVILDVVERLAVHSGRQE
jgi:hypothetical protein